MSLTPSQWARKRTNVGRSPILSDCFPVMDRIVTEILETMRDDPECLLTLRQIWGYLVAPEGEEGAGLVPGKTCCRTYNQFRNWVGKTKYDLWMARK